MLVLDDFVMILFLLCSLFYLMLHVVIGSFCLFDVALAAFSAVHPFAYVVTGDAFVAFIFNFIVVLLCLMFYLISDDYISLIFILFDVMICTSYQS